MRLLTELLIAELDRIEAPARIRERVATMDVETGHMVQMVNELLDLSRMEQASSTVRQDAVELRGWSPRSSGACEPSPSDKASRLNVLVSSGPAACARR